MHNSHESWTEITDQYIYFLPFYYTASSLLHIRDHLMYKSKTPQ